MNSIRTTFLDQIDNEIIEKKEALDLFINLNDNDLAYSNTGYFQLKISDESNIILHFSILIKKPYHSDMTKIYPIAGMVIPGIPQTKTTILK
ncbi:hypothetical protein AB6805_01030 [Chitinophaga sp. RCC_12]|uniref:hypothetical protein n=1 Tax=Chitinophaga sp. RCC_12 TaxID=3239226 RepID=UPI0035261BF4